MEPEPSTHTDGVPPPPTQPPSSERREAKKQKKSKETSIAAIALSVLGLVLSFVLLGPILGGVGVLIGGGTFAIKSRRNRLTLIALITSAVMFLLTLASFFIIRYFVNQSQVFENLARECTISSIMSGVTMGDDSIVLRTSGQDTTGIGFEKIGCALNYLDAPSSVLSKMSSTRALDGMQTAAWSNYIATWTVNRPGVSGGFLKRSAQRIVG